MTGCRLLLRTAVRGRGLLPCATGGFVCALHDVCLVWFEFCSALPCSARLLCQLAIFELLVWLFLIFWVLDSLISQAALCLVVLASLSSAL